MIRQLFWTLFLVLATAGSSRAQITIVEHGPYTEMLNLWTRHNGDPDRMIPGYRIQLLATTDRLKLEEMETRFTRDFPEYPVDWKHEPPYYKLRTGAFTDRSKATAFLYRLKRVFPSAYPAVVKDIRPAELLLYR